MSRMLSRRLTIHRNNFKLKLREYMVIRIYAAE